MSLIKRSSTVLLVLLALLSSNVFAHTYLSAIYLDNTLLDEGDCVRSHPSTAYDSPIPLVTQADMTCGWLPQAAVAANRKCPIAAGSTIGIQWHHSSNSASDDIIADTHLGPVIVYMAKSESGSGNVWFKIYEDGLVNGVWAVTTLLANKGRVDVTIPSDIAPGNYLLRGEILALHSAYDLNGVQPYVGCVELTVSGSGSASPAAVAIPGTYSPSDPGMLFNIYQGITTYPIPGPDVYTAGSSSSSSGSSSSSSGSSSGSVATSAPTSKPPTSSPTTKPPTSAPSAPTGGSVSVQLNSGSNVWWFAVGVSGGSESTVKVELSDGGSVSNFYVLTQVSYGWVYSQSVQLTLPISLRLTSSSGKQIVLSSVFSSWTDISAKNTNKDYTSTATSTSAPTKKPTSAPTSVPTTKPPTSAPTTKPPTSSPTTKPPTASPTTKPPTASPTSKPPTSAPTSSSGGSVTVTQHSSSSAWWFAVSVSSSDVAKVELKDSSSYTSYSALASSDWGYYTFQTTGKALVAPVTVLVTSSSGSTSSTTFNSFNL